MDTSTGYIASVSSVGHWIRKPVSQHEPDVLRVAHMGVGAGRRKRALGSLSLLRRLAPPGEISITARVLRHDNDEVRERRNARFRCKVTSSCYIYQAF